MLLSIREYIHCDDWVEVPTCYEIIKRVQEQAKLKKQSTFDQYPMFEWELGITILDDMTGNEDKGSDEQKPEDELVGNVLEDIYEEEDMDGDSY